MRNYTYHILAAILFFAGVASIQAQTLNDPDVSWGQSVTCIPVNANGYWHAVNSTQLTVTLSATSPQDTDTKKYTGKINYKRGTTELSGNTDFFTLTNNEERSYAASFEYETYTLNTLTGQYESTGQYGFDDSPSKSVKFKTYTQPDISDLEVTSSVKYTYKGANSVQFTANYNYNPGSNGLSYKIEWKKNSTLDAFGNTNTYVLQTNDTGDFTIEATLTVYAPDGQTPWATKTASKTVTVYNKPTVQSLTPEKKYALTDYQPFNVTIALGDNLHSDIQKRVYWYVNGQPTTDTDNNLQTLFNPSTEAKTYEVSAKIEFYVKDGNTDVTLLTLDKNNENKLKTNITVYNRPTVQSLTPEKEYALTDDQSFNVTIALGNNLHSDIQKRVYWYVNGHPTTDTDNNLQTSFAPSTGANTYEVSAKIEFYVKDGNTDVTLLTLDKNNESKLKTNITVYEVPEFTEISSKHYALVDDNISVEAKVSNKHKDIKINITWEGGVVGDSDKLTGTLTPKTANDYTVSAKITFLAPDNQTQLITLPRQGENPITTTITVYEDPTIESYTLNPNTTTIYVGSQLNIEINVNKDEDINAEAVWTTSGVVIDPQNPLKAVYTAPNYAVEDLKIKGYVLFKGKDNIELTRKPVEISIQVLNMNLTYDEYTYKEDTNFNVHVNGYREYSGFEPYVEWSSNLQQDENDPLSAKFIGNISTGLQQISATVYWRSTSVDYKYKLTQSPLIGSVTVYDTPNIRKNKLNNPSSINTYVDGSREITTEVESYPSELPIKINWYVDDKLVNDDDNSEDSIYIFKPKDEEVSTPDYSPQIKAEVVILNPNAPDGKPWLQKFSDPISINVLPNPVDIVGEARLEQIISEPENGDSERIIGYEGQKENDKDKSFTYSVKESPDKKYLWSYTWELYKDNNTTPYATSTIGEFEGLPEGEYAVELKAQPLNPDGNGETWGNPIPCTLENKIRIYSAPQYAPNGNHINESDDTENPYKYSILTNETFDVSKLFSYLDEEGKETGYPGGWKNKLTVKKGENTLKDKSSDLNFAPNEKGEYELTLNVTNNAPTGEWKNETKTYTLYVYDNPTWNIDKIKELFDNPDENGYIRHVESGDEIPFEITGLNGDQNSPWDVTMTIDDGNPDSFTSDKSNSSTTFTHTFKEDNPNETEIIRDFHIQGTNNIQYLTKGTTPTTLDLRGTIHVWKDITATVDGLTPDNDGHYVLETRVGDDYKQELKIKLIGGDSDPSHDKWQINDPNLSTGTPIGTTENPKWDKDNRIYTYTVQDDAFTEAGEYTYTFEPKYIDGATNLVKNTDISPITFKVKVWPEPDIKQSLALSNDDKNVSYTEQSGKYVLICYNSDNLKMTVDPSGGKTGEVWKYQLGTGSMTPIPSDGISIDGEGPKKITFYNYLGEKEKEVKSIDVQISRYSDPKIKTILPTVDNTTDAIWNAATAQNNAVDLYGGVLPDEISRHVAEFDFSPKSSNKGNENGWNYSWKVDNKVDANLVSPTLGKGNYTATTSTNDPSEVKKISVNIKNSIPAVNGQVGENVGMDETKTYYVRVWHEAKLPKDYSLIDVYNKDNNIKDNHAIREGNKLVAQVDPIEYGFSNNYHYDWSGQGEQDDKTIWENEKMTNTDNGDGAGSSSTTYGLHVYNYGPRNNNIWAEKTYEPCKVYIYNRPETPTSLVMKGKGNSGTMIITYTDIMSDGELESRDDYVITFCYTDKDGNLQKIYKPQGGKGEVRWATGFPTDASQMSNVYAYAEWHYVNQETGKNVLITSGKRALDNTESDLNWDESIYNFSDDMMQAIRAITRAGSGDYTDIRSVDPNESSDGEISVYNMNGMKVGTSTKGLTHGIYIIQYKQDGMMKSKKLSVK